MHVRRLEAAAAIFLATAPLVGPGIGHAQTAEPIKPATAGDDADITPTSPVVTRHQGVFGGKRLRYTATAARLPIDGPNGEVDAQIFFAAYTADDVLSARRPITFVMNGGPGSGTAWLHVGALGPRKIALAENGAPLPPPARLVDNPDSPLDRTDLVFIDAPATGYSRVASDAAKTRLYTKDGDIGAFASFIRRYLDQNNRWGSPLYLFGESYGGTRAAGLSDALVRRGVPVKGVVLLSSALDYLVLDASMTNDLPYVLLLPSYAAIAQYHHRADPSLPADPAKLIAAAQAWAQGPYAAALMKGNQLPAEERAATVAGLVRFTGLSANIVDALNLRVGVIDFQRFLQADKGLITGRVDGRLDGPQTMNTVEEPWYDPAMGALTPAFTAATEQYLRNDLGYRSNIPYRMYWAEVARRWLAEPPGTKTDGYLQTLTALQSTAVKNPDFRTLVMGGIYDLAAPFWTTEWNMDHMPMTPELRRNITTVRLPAGHMAYDDVAGMRTMSAALRRFYDAATSAPDARQR